MDTEANTSDWSDLDPWWSVYIQTEPSARDSASTGMFDLEEFTDCWDDLDPWWLTHVDSSPVVYGSSSPAVPVLESLTDSWDGLDSWWEIYLDTGHETAVTIVDLLDQSDEKWRQSSIPFNTDPLSADLTMDRVSRGPLQPTNEVSWSRWLAQLLTHSPELVNELFGTEMDQLPSEVTREDRLSKEDGSIRRPDILVCFADNGFSIEVKLDDENYEKTAETAQLVEQEFDQL